MPNSTCTLCGQPVYGTHTEHPCCHWWITVQGYARCWACAQSRSRSTTPLRLPARPHPDTYQPPESSPRPTTERTTVDVDPVEIDNTHPAYQRGAGSAADARRSGIENLTEILTHGELTGPEEAKIRHTLARLTALEDPTD
jgi:hypothetical protein